MPPSVSGLERKPMQFTENPQNPALFCKRYCEAFEWDEVKHWLVDEWVLFWGSAKTKQLVPPLWVNTEENHLLNSFHEASISAKNLMRRHEWKGKFGNNEQEAQVRLQIGELHHFRAVTPLHSSSLANNTVKQLISLSFLLEWRFVPIYTSWEPAVWLPQNPRSGNTTNRAKVRNTVHTKIFSSFPPT